jgi:hypothetical protein
MAEYLKCFVNEKKFLDFSRDLMVLNIHMSSHMIDGMRFKKARHVGTLGKHVTGEPLWLSGKVVKNEKINEIERTRVRSPPQATSFKNMF